MSALCGPFCFLLLQYRLCIFKSRRSTSPGTWEDGSTAQRNMKWETPFFGWAPGISEISHILIDRECHVDQGWNRGTICHYVLDSSCKENFEKKRQELVTYSKTRRRVSIREVDRERRDYRGPYPGSWELGGRWVLCSSGECTSDSCCWYGIYNFVSWLVIW